MRVALWAIFFGTVIGVLNHVAVIAGILDPPAGFEPAYYIRNLDVPQYLTWAALAKDHWLLPNFHSPWKTEPALFQPMLQIVGKSGLPPIVAYYGFQFLLYWGTAYALIQAFRTFCHSRREMVYAAIVMIGALPLKLLAWTVLKWIGASGPVQSAFASGLIEYSYETADGFLRGGLSNSFTITFGTAITLLGFVSLTRYIKSGETRHFRTLCVVAFLGAFFHPFEVFLVVAGAMFPLWKFKRSVDILWLGMAGGLGIVPYVIQAVRSAWLRDASDLAQWQMSSPAWALLTFGLPVFLICWLLALRPRSDSAEGDVLQSWFLSTMLLPMIPAIPVALHLFDGFAYCLGFLLVRKAAQDQIIVRYRDKLKPAVWAWAGASAAVLVTAYLQIWTDAKSPDPAIGRPAIIAKDERKLYDWMRQKLPRDRVVLAPTEMAPWVATLPMIAMGSHDVFSITFNEQRAAADRFYSGDTSVLDRFGVSYVIAEAPLSAGNLIHQEGKLRLYETPGRALQPYPGKATAARNGFRSWIFHLLGAGEQSASVLSSEPATATNLGK